MTKLRTPFHIVALDGSVTPLTTSRRGRAIRQWHQAKRLNPDALHGSTLARQNELDSAPTALPVAEQ